MPEATKSAPKVFVALDFKERGAALKLLRELNGLPVQFKVGLELFIAEGPNLVREVAKGGREVFLDLKLHDIPNTVAQAALRAADLGVGYLTLHAMGGRAMFQATRDQLSKHSHPPKLLAVSVLTSFDAEGWREVTGSIGSANSEIAATVCGMAVTAQDWGADGLICSPHELALVKKVAPALEVIVPGIRPQGSEPGDQARVMTPAEARALGAAGIVIGRPITQAKDPRAATEAILRALTSD